MKPQRRFLGRPSRFWANVRLVSERLGYTQRGQGQIRVPTLRQTAEALRGLGLSTDHLIAGSGRPTEMGRLLVDYFAARVRKLNAHVAPNLMSSQEARTEFQALRKTLRPSCPIPMNKQKGKKRTPAYLTGIVNMLIEANAQGVPCDYDPQRLTTITHHGAPLRTLARRVDGCFPRTVDPVALWEVKEYYYTTTFGSRVADGVYESLLDGMELQELASNAGVKVRHYLMVDARYAWWDCGKSYLCRIFDMLHMGYVDEVLFGREVIERLPVLVRQWVRLVRKRQ